jgi:hypothetical protein
VPGLSEFPHMNITVNTYLPNITSIVITTTGKKKKLQFKKKNWRKIFFLLFKNLHSTGFTTQTTLGLDFSLENSTHQMADVFGLYVDLICDVSISLSQINSSAILISAIPGNYVASASEH